MERSEASLRKAGLLFPFARGMVLATILKAPSLYWPGLVVGVLLLANCGRPKEPARERSTQPTRLTPSIVIPSQKASQSVERQDIRPLEYELSGYRIALLSDGDCCSVSYRQLDSNAEPQYFTLALSPPCYWLRGDFSKNPFNRKFTGGIPVSNKGGIMAIKYPSARNTTVAIIIGRSKGKSDDPELMGYYKGKECASHMQGVLLSKNGVRLSEPEYHVGIRCSEYGTDEKEFWLFAHDDLKKTSPRSKQ